MPLDVCTRELECAAAWLFGMDPQIVSVGIILMPGGYGFGVRRHRAPGVATLHCKRLHVGTTIHGIAVEVSDLHGPLQPLIELPSSAANGPTSATTPEQDRLDPLCSGAQLQNWDADARAGLLARERFVVGSLGMLLERDDGRMLLSNNHVLAAQNRGRIGDRIAQPGGARLDPSQVVARLERFVPLEPSPIAAHPSRGTVVWNRVDAALARVSPGIECVTGYAAGRSLPSPRGLAEPELGERVFKVGRTTGLRFGVITSIHERVGPIPYAIGPCWFSGSFVIESDDGLPFSDGGDSGAVVVRTNGEILGLIYAGNGSETYACPITEVLAALA